MVFTAREKERRAVIHVATPTCRALCNTQVEFKQRSPRFRVSEVSGGSNGIVLWPRLEDSRVHHQNVFDPLNSSTPSS
ncbi:hypothetical protein EYF80_014417 [Liparis tanakae]|uniref:Uncharacterized protein n=1 Tax=Liparis tanakae TaxID=230148 RepID=A0A4Z2IBV0_9TELE|nr:hypothetical protein EYF80_014417 [Liparis tanakae]